MTTRAPAVETCCCGQSIICTSQGKPLDAQPDLLGVHRPDGTWQTAHDKIQKIPGYHSHRCPGPRDVQQELFG
jgi:hypothetical protein